MSAFFVLKFGKLFVRVVEASERTVCELVNRSHATTFTSEPEAWQMAHTLRLQPDLCSVESAGSAGRAATGLASQREASHQGRGK